MNGKSKITLVELKRTAALALLTLEKGRGVNGTAQPSGKAGEVAGGGVTATLVGQTVALRYNQDEYRSRLSQAKDARDYTEAIQLIEEGVQANLPFLTDQNTKRDIESVIRGLKESEDIESAVILANYCFRNKINYETKPNPITTRTLIVSGQKQCPFETALLTTSALESGITFFDKNDEKMITTTAAHTHDVGSHESNLAYGKLVLTAIKYNHLKDSQFIETSMAILANPGKKETEIDSSQINQRAEIAYNIALEYLEKGIEIVDKTRIDKTIHDLRRIPGHIPNALRLLLKALKREDLDTSSITVESTISAVKQHIDLDKKTGETLYKVISSALEKYERDSFNSETFDLLCQALMKEDAGKAFAIQIAIRCAEYGYILEARTYENIYTKTAESQEVQKRGDLRTKREQLPNLITLANQVNVEEKVIPKITKELRGGTGNKFF